jgi:hypothetical protein
VLDFRAKRTNKRQVPNYLGGREQRRLLLLVGMLSLLAVVTPKVNDPGLWRWMFAGAAASEGAADDDARNSSAWGDRVDTRLPRSPEVAESLDVVRVEPAADVAGPVPDARKQLFPGVRPEWLATIRDDTVLRGTEHEALYSLLAILASADERALAAASRGPASYLQLFKQPDEYRGELVTLSGTVHKAVYREAAANQQGIKGFYKLALQPDDHPAGLIFVDCLELPEGSPTGERVRFEVELVGLSYKRWAYAAQDGIRTAPLLLAKTVTWTDAPAASAAPPTPWPGLAASVLIAGVACLLAVAWVFWRPSPANRPHTEERQSGEILRELAALEAAALDQAVPGEGRPLPRASLAVERARKEQHTMDDRTD